MSKKDEKQTPETPETPETPKVSMKDLKAAVLNFAASVQEVGNFEDENGEPNGAAYLEVKAFAPFDALKSLAAVIAETSQRGLPLETRLANLENERNEHYASVKVVDGKPAFSPEWVTKNDELTAKINSVKAQIKRAESKKTEETPANTETAKA